MRGRRSPSRRGCRMAVRDRGPALPVRATKPPVTAEVEGVDVSAERPDEFGVGGDEGGVLAAAVLEPRSSPLLASSVQALPEVWRDGPSSPRPLDRCEVGVANARSWAGELKVDSR